MNRYIKLVNFEMNRIAKLYVVLLAVTFVSQVVGVIYFSKHFLKQVNEAMTGNPQNRQEVIESMSPLSFDQVTETLLFVGPILISITAVAFYIFIIWYRDWLGKNTFVYRLLMLPTARINVFFAKLTTILLMTFGLVAFQLMLLPFEMKIMQWIVPKDLRIDASINAVLDRFVELRIIFPESFIEFILHYGLGTIIVAIVFTFILFERSFRWKGIIFGFVYGFIAFMLLFSPVLLNELVLNSYLYPSEIVLLEVVAGIIVMACTVWMSHYLLTKKIRV
ncbi:MULTISPECIES: hypothetical protein [unclassified Virgibacillus]|uniref:hypothetical protein n=1 Tax=unclassified Virgibacillus TaxID=2620237 RepID=UPI0024DED104|nr:hypothetical protein [Virgibacillus sp. LDC-1]